MHFPLPFNGIGGRGFLHPCCTQGPTTFAGALRKRPGHTFRSLLGSDSPNASRVAAMATGGQSASQGLVSGLFRVAGRTSIRTVRLAASVLISLVLIARAWRLFVRYTSDLHKIRSSCHSTEGLS